MFHRKAEPEKVIRMYKIMWSFVLENQSGDERKRVKHGIKKRKYIRHPQVNQCDTLY